MQWVAGKKMTQKLSVVFCWHMHQPFYKEADSGQYHLPWVYLHAMKDYTDIATLLSQIPGARSVVNFVPSLMIQIDDYATQLRAWLNGNQDALPDPLLNALVAETFSATDRKFLLESCFRLNHDRNMHRYSAYSRLFSMAEHAKTQEVPQYLGSHFFTDLVTWYHLGWLGETVRNSHFVARRLFEKGQDFSLQDRKDLLALIASLLTDIPKQYRKLQEDGKVELSTTPYAHPIIPLLLDFETARETVEDALLPAEQSYPGGEASSLAHIKKAREVHQQFFGCQPAGCWPAEGALSSDTMTLLDKDGFTWTATGESVLHHSLKKNEIDFDQRSLYQPWKIDDHADSTVCFFRDDRLSDLIGFEYSRWDARDAVANFMHELAGIHHKTQGMKNPCVSIIMDGENAWEHYHENGLLFLTTLFQEIASHSEYELTTFSEYLKTKPEVSHVPNMVSGSWVYGNLSTWIGDVAKTRAWDYLVDVKKAYDENYSKLSPEQQEAAELQLRICEGSDWFWWLGDYNPGDTVRDFDRLFRQHIKKLYQMIDVPWPTTLEHSISQGGGDAEGGGTMRRGAEDH